MARGRAWSNDLISTATWHDKVQEKGRLQEVKSPTVAGWLAVIIICYAANERLSGEGRDGNLAPEYLLQYST